MSRESAVVGREMVEGRDSLPRAGLPELRCYSTPSGSEEERRGARRAWLTPGPLTRLRSSNYDEAREVGPGAMHIGPRCGPEVESVARQEDGAIDRTLRLKSRRAAARALLFDHRRRVGLPELRLLTQALRQAQDEAAARPTVGRRIGKSAGGKPWAVGRLR